MLNNDVPAVAYFFFRLPEVLNMPPGPHFLDIDGPVSGAGGVRSVLESPVPGTRVVTMVLHQVGAGSSDSEDLVLLSELASKAVPWAFPPLRRYPWRLFRLPRLLHRRSANSVNVTVVEAAVSLVDSFDPNADPTVANQELTRGLDDVLEAVNALQLMHYIVSRVPKSRLSAETLPGLVPFVLGQYSHLGMIPVQMGLGIFINDLGQAAHDKRFHIDDGDSPVEHGDVVTRGPFTKYLQLRMEAQALLELRGEYRASILILAAATESLLDTTLMLLLWESGLSPEDGAGHFRPNVSVTRRVREQFHRLLRDTPAEWNPLTGSGPIANWNRGIAMVRNEVIHYGSRVDRDSAWRA